MTFVPPMTFPRLPQPMRSALRAMPRGGSAALFAAINLRSVLQEGARAGLKVRMRYHKKTTGRTVLRDVAPYEIKGRMLWLKHKHTKSFILSRIEDAVLTDKKSRPDYPVSL